MNAIIIDYDPFGLESRVSIYRNGIQETLRVYSDIEKMAQAIIGVAYKNNTFEVKTNAPESFISGLSTIISDYELAQYSEQKIKVRGF